MSRFDSDLLPEGLRLEGDKIVDAQDEVWVTFAEGGNGDSPVWREMIVELCCSALGTGLSPQKESPLYYFSVRFRNDTMGFTKNFDVFAPNARTAVLEGEKQLGLKGYFPERFEAIEVVRGRQQGT